jgi:hypothetical protein
MPKPMSPDFVVASLVSLKAAADKEAYTWLEENQPELLTAVEEAIKAGATPETIHRFWVSYTGEHRIELATRLKLAARYALTLQTKAQAE